MNKKKIGITFVALVCLAVVVLTIFYMISNGKISGSRESKSSTTEVDKLMSKDLDNGYPETPTEVLKLYWRYNKCLYNTTLTDKEYNKLLKQLRKLYDAELLDVKDNAWEKMNKRLAKERKSYKKKEQTISTYVVQPAGSIEYTTINKRECATVITGTLTKAKQKRMQIYEKFLCRKDAKGKWRILGWEQTTDKEEIATLGDN